MAQGHNLLLYKNEDETLFDAISRYKEAFKLAKDKSIYLSGEGDDIQIELLEGNENT